MKPKRLHTITIHHTLSQKELAELNSPIPVSLTKIFTHTVTANSPQNACRKAFKHFLKTGKLKRQPKTDDAGGFVGVEVTLL